jgi:hypothetical protein
MIYKHLVTRRQRNIVHHCMINTSCPNLSLALVDPIAPIHHTCRFLRAEATNFLKTSVASAMVPRIVLTYRDYDILAIRGARLAVRELVRIINDARKSSLTTFSVQRDYRPVIGPLEDNRSRFDTPNYAVLAQFGNIAASYLRRPGSQLHIAVKGMEALEMSNWRDYWDS